MAVRIFRLPPPVQGQLLLVPAQDFLVAGVEILQLVVTSSKARSMNSINFIII